MEDVKDAMRRRDELRLSVLRMLRSAIGYDEIEKGHTLNDDEVAVVVAKEIRKRRESIAAYQRVSRPDRAQREEAEAAVLQKYLPQQLTAEEIRQLAQNAIQEVGARGPADKGRVMGRLMPQVKGRADGAQVNAAVTELLERRASP